jgi:hypothetical protein
MTPERMAALVALWVRFYSRGLSAPTARRRIDEIDADLHDHIAHERSGGTSDRRIALSIASRMLRGVAADAAWRGHHAKASTAYRSAVAVAIATAFFLVWLVGAVGLIGVEGDRADLMYGAVLAVGIVGASIARFQPAGAARASGMARALLAMALVTALIAVIALIAGKHQAPITSVFELLGLNAIFVALFLGSAWLFRHAARKHPPGDARTQG